ncbi:MAG: P-loop NTPase, partial [Nitrospina sp.]|nr:P-loop NTPase [Nitrospina sp.]
MNIIPVGGGKGGIGKSVISTNLAVGIALSGQKVVLMDGDFGASNLHALLGISHPLYGFQDLFTNDKAPDSLLIETGISNLKFISSAGDNPGSANIDSERVKKIISFIKKIDADTVILDLGPGTSFNVLDFFNISSKGIIMSSPETTSVMKTFSFIRSALFRRLSKKLKNLSALQKLVDYSKLSKNDLETYTLATLRENIKKVDETQIKKLDEIVNEFKPAIIINRVRNKKDLLAGNNLVNLAKKYLEVELNYIGY